MTIDEIIAKQSEQSSTIGRQIAFALIAVSWSLSKNDQGFFLNLFPYISMILLVGYLSIDLSQYFFTTIRYRRVEIEYAIAKANCLEEEKEGIDKNYNLEKYKNSRFSYRLFIIKFIFIPIAVLLLFINLVQQIFK